MKNIFWGDGDGSNDGNYKLIARCIFVIGVLLAVFLSVKIVNSFREGMLIGINPQNPPSISVTAYGEVFAVPDVVEFSFAVIEEGKKASDIQPILNKKMNKVIDALKARGIKELNIKTLAYDIQPKYQYKDIVCRQIEGCDQTGNSIIGYQIRQSVSVKIKDNDIVNVVLDDLGKLNVSELSSLQYTVEDEEKLSEEARGIAIAKAREKALVLANSLGVTLGKVLSFSENNYGNQMYMRSDAMPMSSSVSVKESANIPVGENKTRVDVQVTYRIR